MQGTQVWSLVWEDAAWGNQAGMPQLLRLCSRAQAPQEKPRQEKPVPHNQREPFRHKEDPAQPQLAK